MPSAIPPLDRIPAPARRSRPQAGARALKPDGPAPLPRGVPSGYGDTRVVALARDPYWLCVYWEVTDEAIAAARARLGTGGPDAVCALRVYDTTYRLFDGTNANSYFDVPVERAWNNYSLKVSRPRTIFHVEVGMKSHEGYFAHMARSAAAEMPADSVAGEGEGDIRWMTVTPAHGGARPSTYAHRYAAGPRADWRSPPAYGGAWSDAASSEGVEVIQRSTFLETRFERVLSLLLGGETTEGEWIERVLGARFVRWVRWEGGERQLWHSDPRSVTWEHVGPVQVWSEGRRRLFAAAAGGDLAELGPWHVVITGRGAHGERRLLNSWEVRMAWGGSGVVGGANTPAIYRRLFGAYGKRELFPAGSELRIREQAGASQELFAGASMWPWQSAGERFLGGASELAALGASEILGRGASETHWSLAGASEVVLGGANLLAAAGASEQRFFGASEVLLGGASLYAGASEIGFAGASKAAFGGASEVVFPGGSEAVVAIASGDSGHVLAAVTGVAGPAAAAGRAVGPPQSPHPTPSNESNEA